MRTIGGLLIQSHVHASPSDSFLPLIVRVQDVRLRVDLLDEDSLPSIAWPLLGNSRNHFINQHATVHILVDVDALG